MNTASTSPSGSGYRPIEDYGVIGDMHTVALVGTDGSIDWCCLPRFDGPSVFARLLDAETGGHFQVALRGDDVTTKQFYWPDTNVLVTRFLSNDGVGEVRDFMPVAGRAAESDRRQIIRMVRAVRGTVTFRVSCRPAFDYARADHETVRTNRGVCFHGDEQALSLATEIDLPPNGDGVAADVTLREGASTTLLLRDIDPGEGCAPTLSPEAAERAFRDTVQYWRDWLRQCTYTGRWREEGYRSALVLKLPVKKLLYEIALLGGKLVLVHKLSFPVDPELPIGKPEVGERVRFPIRRPFLWEVQKHLLLSKLLLQVVPQTKAGAVPDDTSDRLMVPSLDLGSLLLVRVEEKENPKVRMRLKLLGGALYKRHRTESTC